MTRKKSAGRLVSLMMSLCLLLALLPGPALATKDLLTDPLVLFYITASAGVGGSIYPSGQMMIQKDQSATYFITPDEGYQLVSVTIDGQVYGPIFSYTFSQVTSNHVIMAIFEPVEPPDSTLPTIPTEPGTPALPADKLTDIGQHWAYASITSAVNAGLFSGTTETLFSPDQAMTRGMFVSVLARLHGAELSAGELPFTDVGAGMYYRDAISWAYRNGIVSGMSETLFAPDLSMNREQMATMILRYLTLIGKAEGSPAGDPGYVDLDLVSPYALDGVRFCSEKGLFVGKLGNAFDPQGAATRAETAVLFTRLQSLLAK